MKLSVNLSEIKCNFFHARVLWSQLALQMVFFVKNKTVPITEWGIISIMVQQQIHTFTLKLRQTPTYTLIHCLNTLIHFSPQFRKNIINRGGGGCKNRSAVGRGVAKWGHLRFNLVGKHTMIRSQLTRFSSDFFIKYCSNPSGGINPIVTTTYTPYTLQIKTHTHLHTNTLSKNLSGKGEASKRGHF